MPPKQFPLRPKDDRQGGQRGRGGGARGGPGRGRGGRGGARGGYGGQENISTSSAAPVTAKVEGVPAMQPGQLIYNLAVRDPKGGSQHVVHPSAQTLPNNKFRVKVNYFQMTKFPTALVEYSVVLGKIKFGPNGDMERSVTRRDEKNSVLNSLQTRVPFNSLPWAHSITSVWLLQRLGEDQIVLENVLFMGKNGREERMDRVTLNFVGEYTVKKQKAVSAERERTITGLNAFIASAISRGSNDIFQIGSNKFFYENGWTRLDWGFTPNRPQPPSLEQMDLLAYRGYFFSTRITDSGLFLNVNTSTSAFFRPMRVSQFLQNFGGRDPKPVLPSMIGLSVRRIYDIQPGKDPDDSINDPHRRIKRITEFGEVPKNQLCRTSGEDTTVAEYYKAGGLSIVSDLPCVNVGAKSRPGELSRGTWIPAEFLEILPHQPYTRLLNGSYTKNMLDVACKRPHENLFLIMNEGMPKINLQQLHPKLGLAVNNTPTLVDAKKLRMPDIQYQGTSTRPLENAKWNARLSNNPNESRVHKYIQRKPNMSSIGALYMLDLCNTYKRRLDEAQMTTLYKNLVAQLEKHGVQAPKSPNIKEIVFSLDIGKPDFQQALERELQPGLFPGGITRSTFLLVILPVQDQQLYATIKTVCDSKIGIKSICCLRDKLLKSDGPYLSNVALKFTFKLGGDVHNLPGLDPLRGSRRVMVMGADVTHPQASSILGCPSIAGVVGSVDRQFMRFPGSMRLNPSRQEIIADLKEMVAERIEAYFSASGGQKPTEILFYRDGVSESQYRAVQDTEVKAIRDGYSNWVKSKKPDSSKEACDVKLTFIIVGKRHNTRFYPSALNQQDGRNNSNVKPGFVVDSNVVMSNGDDFYLQSHSAIKGTARPAHYIILENGMELQQDTLHKITHEFCFAYARATLGVSYCAPAYYADRLCERGRCFLRPWLVPAFNDQTLNKYAAPRVMHNTPNEARRAMEAHRRDVVERISRDAQWNPRGETPRKNPWHPNMDDIQFYL